MGRNLILALPVTLMAAGAAGAQPPAARADIMPRADGGNQVRVSVSISFFVPGAVDGSDDSFTAQEQVRRKVYGSAARECDVLRATIASTCRLESINVNVNPNYSYRGQLRERFNVRGNFAFRITLK
jgi:hypothetical protein